jgi:hypothetical protein
LNNIITKEAASFEEELKHSLGNAEPRELDNTISKNSVETETKENKKIKDYDN